MGIKSINKLLRRKCPSAILQTSISKFANQLVFVDTSIFMYKYKYSNDILSGFLEMINKLYEFNITPVFVFDGKPEENKIVIKERKEKKEKAKSKIQKLEKELLEEADRSGIIIVDKLPSNIEMEEAPESIQKIINEIEKTEKNNISVTWQDFEQVKKLFKSMNIHYIQANCESDILIPYLIQKYNVTPLCLSGDTDFLAHNVNLISKFDNRNGIIEYFDIKKIKEELNLTDKQFVDMCILMGCDYCESLSKIGPMTAYKIIKKFDNLENYFKHINKTNIQPYLDARNIFLNIPDLNISLPENFNVKSFDKNNFKSICEELNINERIQNKTIKRNTLKYNPITNYFKVKK